SKFLDISQLFSESGSFSTFSSMNENKISSIYSDKVLLESYRDLSDYVYPSNNILANS
ncbi:3639_t:CDS:1, partial [Racocetra persica]